MATPRATRQEQTIIEDKKPQTLHEQLAAAGERVKTAKSELQFAQVREQKEKANLEEKQKQEREITTAILSIAREIKDFQTKMKGSSESLKETLENLPTAIKPSEALLQTITAKNQAYKELADAAEDAINYYEALSGATLAGQLDGLINTKQQYLVNYQEAVKNVQQKNNEFLVGLTTFQQTYLNEHPENASDAMLEEAISAGVQGVMEDDLASLQSHLKKMTPTQTKSSTIKSEDLYEALETEVGRQEAELEEAKERTQTVNTTKDAVETNKTNNIALSQAVAKSTKHITEIDSLAFHIVEQAQKPKQPTISISPPLPDKVRSLDILAPYDETLVTQEGEWTAGSHQTNDPGAEKIKQTLSDTIAQITIEQQRIKDTTAEGPSAEEKSTLATATEELASATAAQAALQEVYDNENKAKTALAAEVIHALRLGCKSQADRAMIQGVIDQISSAGKNKLGSYAMIHSDINNLVKSMESDKKQKKLTGSIQKAIGILTTHTYGSAITNVHNSRMKPIIKVYIDNFKKHKNTHHLKDNDEDKAYRIAAKIALNYMQHEYVKVGGDVSDDPTFNRESKQPSELEFNAAMKTLDEHRGWGKRFKIESKTTSGRLVGFFKAAVDASHLQESKIEPPTRKSNKKTN